MVAELQTPGIELYDMTGAEARALVPDGPAWPNDSTVCLALEGGKVVGHSSLVTTVLIEGTVVAESKSGTSLAFRLVHHMEELLKSGGNPAAFAFAPDDDPKVGDYLSRTGYIRLPVTLYLKSLGSEVVPSP